jgi:cellobiose-specific phosphotransferase system component IIA
MHARFTRTPLAAAILLAGLGGRGLPAVASTVQEDVTVTPARPISASDEAVISSAAVKVLRHIAEARGQLQGDKPDPEAAKAELAKAESLLDIIEAALPPSTVKDRIWVASKHLEYMDTQEVLPDLVPIFASLDEVANYMPVGQAKAHLDKAKEAMGKDQKEQAKEELKQVDEALVYLEADLPLGSTRTLVDQAKEDLGKGDTKAADEALSSAEANVVFLSVSFDSPLTQAKSALWRAREGFDSGDKAIAKTNLQQAVSALERAANTKDELVRREAGKLVEDVRDLDRLLETNDAGFPAGIDRAWQRAQALSERTAEYVSTGWERLRAKSPGKEDLIEAKLYLAYGRIDLLVAKDQAAAKVDLAEAEGYLKSAADKVNAETKPELDAVASQVAALDKSLGEAGGKQPDAIAFQGVETGLSALIRQL